MILMTQWQSRFHSDSVSVILAPLNVTPTIPISITIGRSLLEYYITVYYIGRLLTCQLLCIRFRFHFYIAFVADHYIYYLLFIIYHLSYVKWGKDMMIIGYRLNSDATFLYHTGFDFYKSSSHLVTNMPPAHCSGPSVPDKSNPRLSLFFLEPPYCVRGGGRKPVESGKVENWKIGKMLGTWSLMRSSEFGSGKGRCTHVLGWELGIGTGEWPMAMMTEEGRLGDWRLERIDIYLGRG